MAIPGPYPYRHGISHLDTLDSAAFHHQAQFVVPPARGHQQLTAPASLGLPGAFASGLLSQNWHTGNTSDYPPIHVHPGASATIHLNIFPYTSPNPNHHHNLFDSNIIPPTNSHHSLILGPNVTTSSSALHHHHQHHSLPQCHHCDYRFSSPYLLTDHLTRNAHHCARCRQCFPSWDEHYGCEDGGVDGYREHLWAWVEEGGYWER
ncbi:hypothetical protein B0J12DRAFT_703188 [Macrophomina phaseolina]|uniref:C2H2-type domain-containing protein n=1 Tax=Macrophomina phaseolina TaxID=35725 RepID=A0ABQ8FZI5_9PEZI|nr:hypothetical protein B0J12DRAFT_703188 [Macrophomina phaseolina]